MFVKKYKLLKNLTGSAGYNINIPIGNNSGFVGQQDIIEKEFINIEVEKAVNIIFDYEKIKLLPYKVDTPNTYLIDNITYVVNVLNKPLPSIITGLPLASFNKSVKWSDIGFNDSDLSSKKKSFTKSFLRLDFYDSDIVSNQNLISSITLFPKFNNDDIIDDKIPQAINYDLSFKLGNPLTDRNKNGEGFALYHFKDEILPKPLPSKNLYARATFNNAKEGTSTGLMSSDKTTLYIDELIGSTENKLPYGSVKNNLYTKYILTRGDTGYFYEIDTMYSNNVTFKRNGTTPNITNDYTINLYQINAI